jgi:hypothetical protein
MPLAFVMCKSGHSAPYRSPAKAAYLCAEVPPAETFAHLMFNSDGLSDWQGIVFVQLHEGPLNAAATVIGPYHLWGDAELIALIKAALS